MSSRWPWTRGAFTCPSPPIFFVTPRCLSCLRLSLYSSSKTTPPSFVSPVPLHPCVQRFLVAVFSSIFVSISGGPGTSELLIAPPPLHSYSTLQAAQVKTTPCSHEEREFCRGLRTCEQLAGNHNGRFGVHCMFFLSNSTGPAPDGLRNSSSLPQRLIHMIA